MNNMGGLIKAKMPAPLPAPARPVTAVTQTPDIELDDTDLMSDALAKRKKGKQGLKTELTDQMSAQTGSTASGLQIPQGGQ